MIKPKKEIKYYFVSGYSEQGFEGFITHVESEKELVQRLKALNIARKKLNKPIIQWYNTHGKENKKVEL